VKLWHVKIIVLVFTIAVFMQTVAAVPAEPAGDKGNGPGETEIHSHGTGPYWYLDKITFIHYAKPPGPDKGQKPVVCYKLLGPKWPDTGLPIEYHINPADSGLDVSFVQGAVTMSTEQWDGGTFTELFADLHVIDGTATYNDASPDNINSISFGDIQDNSIIAVTNIWYTRAGKRIVDSDILFNTYYPWGNADTDSALMDLQNIATHEEGHTIGLGDLYSTACNPVTMYGYSTNGETQKRTLESPDVAGLQKLYGS